jgi:hypothetical protein
MKACPKADVLFVGHVGYDEAVSLLNLINGKSKAMRVLPSLVVWRNHQHAHATLLQSFSDFLCSVFGFPVSVKIFRLAAEDVPKDELGAQQAVFKLWKEVSILSPYLETCSNVSQMDEWIYSEKASIKTDCKAHFARIADDCKRNPKLYLTIGAGRP